MSLQPHPSLSVSNPRFLQELTPTDLEGSESAAVSGQRRLRTREGLPARRNSLKGGKRRTDSRHRGVVRVGLHLIEEDGRHIRPP